MIAFVSSIVLAHAVPCDISCRRDVLQAANARKKLPHHICRAICTKKKESRVYIRRESSRPEFREVTRLSVLLHTDVCVVPLNWVLDATLALFVVGQILHVNVAERHVVHALHAQCRTRTACAHESLNVQGTRTLV